MVNTVSALHLVCSTADRMLQHGTAGDAVNAILTKLQAATVENREELAALNRFLSGGDTSPDFPALKGHVQHVRATF